MQKWEYYRTTTAIIPLNDDQLNALGARGWELVAVTVGLHKAASGFEFERTEFTYFFKRPIEAKKGE